MIDFVTLLVGIITGLHTVEVVVQPRVAAVELRLGERVVGRLEEPPWKLDIDFGSEIVPTELEAVALGPGGAVIGRVRQAINRPRENAQARLVLERDDEHRVTAARISWQSLTPPGLVGSFVCFDGQVLELREGGRIDLPPHEPQAFHLLQVELLFADGTRTEARLGFGGGKEARSDLAAVPVRVGGGGRPSASELADLLLENGAPVDVVAVEQGQAKVLVVRAEGVVERLREMEERLLSAAGSAVAGQGSAEDEDALGERLLRQALALPGSEDLGVIIPLTAPPVRPHLRIRLFPRSPWLTRADGGLYRALMQRLQMPGEAREQRLADAVAVAALEAVAGDRRRAVVLVEVPESEDRSYYSMPTVERFLEALDVPFHVWTLAADGGGAGPSDPGSTGRRIASLEALEGAARELQEDLETQQVVWVSGRHPAGSIELSTTAGARGVRRLSSGEMTKENGS